MIKNVLSKVSNVVKNNAEEIGQKAVAKIQDDLARSPRHDSFVSIPHPISEKITPPSIPAVLPKIENQEDLITHLASLRAKSGRARFSSEDIEYIASSINSSADTVEKAQFNFELAGKLAQLEDKNGNARLDIFNLLRIVSSADTVEKAQFKFDMTRQLALLECKNGEPRLGFDSIGAIVSATDTVEKALYKTALVSDKGFFAKIDALEEPFGSSFCRESLKVNAEVDVDRMNKLYLFLKENKINLQQYGQERVTNASVVNLFKLAMIKTADLVDDGVIKYAAKLKYDKFREFIDNTAGFSKKLDRQTYQKLKENLSKLTTPGEKLERLQGLIALSVKADCFEPSVVGEALELFKSPKTTVAQVNLANKIFTSSSSYREQIKEFLVKFDVPIERRAKIVAFLEKSKLNEKIVINNRTKEKIILKQASQQLAQQIEAHINIPKGKSEFNNFLNSKLYKRLDIKPTQKLLETLNFDKQYLPKLFSAVGDETFSVEFKKLIKLVETDPSRPLSELRESLDCNKATKKLFEQHGINYQKWTKFEKNSFNEFSCEVDLQEGVQAVELNITKELNGELFDAVDNTQTDKILRALAGEGYQLKRDRILKDGVPVCQKDLERIVDVFKDTINKNSDFWDKPLANVEQEKLKTELIDRLLKGCKKEVADLATIAGSKMDLIVRLADNDDIGRNIFLGDHIGCCTGVTGRCNFAAPQHLMNSFVRAIEIVDKSGNSYGNSMCYFAKVDNKLSFVIDSFDAKGSLCTSHTVTAAAIDYAKMVAKEMCKSDIPIYLGTKYNNINSSDLKRLSGRTVEIVGRVDKETYIDAIGGARDVNMPHFDLELYREKQSFLTSLSGLFAMTR